MAETIKAYNRRVREGWFDKYFPTDVAGIDIGCQKDFLNATYRRYDLIYGDSDCTFMAGIPDASYDRLYASHVLEHVLDPVTCLRNWWRILKPGGIACVIVPSRDHYEKRKQLPSRWNGDHKTFWTLDVEEPPCTWSLKHTIERALPDAEFLELRYCLEGYQANGDFHSSGEYSLEAVLRKPG